MTETTTQVERVARAMQADAGKPADELYWSTPCTGAVVWRSLAKAAIKAMSDAEPVAWKCQERTMGAWHIRYVDERPTGERYRNIVPLYAARQPHTAPMSHEQGRDEVEMLREALRPFVDGAAHTMVFLTSREKMHSCGVDLYREDVERTRAALSPPLS